MTTEELKVVISAELKDFNKKLDQIQKDVKKAGNGVEDFGNAFDKAGIKAGAMSAIVSKAVDGVLSLAKTGAGAVKKVVSDSLSAYSDYEQLSGGIDKLFTYEGDNGEEVKTAVDKIAGYANDAWETAGMSMNEYMETATAFSASLISSVGAEKSADLVNQAIVSMSDNVNTFGSSMDSVSNAYKGFAKGNYTMLDNLNLGYAGTQAGMAQLMEDAKAIDDTFNDFEFGLNKKGQFYGEFSDIIKAIDIIQQNYGIAGTTAKEASKTIEGSMKAMKASWTNFLTGLGRDDADMNKLTKNLTKSLKNVIKNVVPRVAKIAVALIKNIPTVVKQLKKTLKKVLPEVWEEVYQMLPDGAKGILIRLKDIAIKITDAIKNHGKVIIGAVGSALAITKIAPMIKPLFSLFGSGGMIGKLFQGVGKLGGGKTFNPITILKALSSIGMIIGGITAIIVVYGALSQVPKFNEFMDKGIQTLGKLFDGLKDIMNVELLALIGVIEGLGFAGIGTAVQGITSFATLLGGLTILIEAFGALSQIPQFNEFLDSGIETLKTLFKGIGEIAGSLVDGFMATAFDSLAEVGQHLSEFMENAKPFFEGMDSFNGKSVDEFIGALLALAGADLLNKFESLLGLGEMNLGEIGIQLAEFADGVQPFFDKVQNIDEGAVSKGTTILKSLGALNGIEFKSGGFLQKLIGETDISGVGKQLSSFIENAIPFYEGALQISQGSIDRGKAIIEALGVISGYEFKSGGLLQKITGEVSLGRIGEELTTFITNAIPFFTKTALITDKQIQTAVRILRMVGNIDAEMTGGIVDIFTGSIHLGDIGADLTEFITNVIPFFTKTSLITDAQIKTANKIIEFVGNIDVELFGGFADLFTGRTNLAKWGSDLSAFGESIVPFFTNANQVDGTAMNRGFNLLKRFSNVEFGDNFNIEGYHLSDIGDNLPAFAKGVASAFSTLKYVSTDVDVSAIVKPLGELVKKIGKKQDDLEKAISGLNKSGKVDLANLQSSFETTTKNIADRWGDMTTRISNSSNVLANNVANMVSSVRMSLNALQASINGVQFNLQKAIKVPYWTLEGDFDLEKHLVPKVKTGWHYMAKGGIVDGATPIIAGEQGKEAIVPLERNTQWIDKLASKLQPNVYVDGNSGLCDANITVQVNVGGRDFGMAVIDSINEAMDMNGEVLLAI